jgi:hypothetical protein
VRQRSHRTTNLMIDRAAATIEDGWEMICTLNIERSHASQVGR